MSPEYDQAAVNLLDGELGLTFFVLFDEKNFRQAGQRLGVSGTTVRNRMNQIEALLGFKLCSSDRKFAPTPNGELLYSRCSRAREAFQTSVVDALQQIGGRSLRIATTSIGLRIDLPQVLHRWRHDHQDIAIHITNPPSGGIVTAVLEGRATFGICGRHYLEKARRDHDVRVVSETFESPSLSVGYPTEPLDANAREHLQKKLSILAINTFFGWVVPSNSEFTLKRLFAQGVRKPNIKAEVGDHEDAVEYAAQGHAAVLTWSPLIRRYPGRLIEVAVNPDPEVEMPPTGGVFFYSEFTKLTDWEEDFRSLFLEEMRAKGRFH